MRLTSDDCHIWWAELDSIPPRYDILNEDEIIRIKSLKFLNDKKKSAASFTFLRLVLSKYIGKNPKEIPIIRSCKECGEPHGKPWILENYKNIKFNLSHSEKNIVVGLSIKHDIGIDIEEKDTDLNSDVFSHVLSVDELRALNSLPLDEKNNNFLKYWTRKESIVKAIGIGLNVNLSELIVSNYDENPKIHKWEGFEQKIKQYTMVEFKINQAIGCVTVMNSVSQTSIFNGNGI